MRNVGPNGGEGSCDAMQVCLNGHVITDSYYDYPDSRKPRCPECGAETIFVCQSCQKEIRGRARISGMIFPYTLPARKYCDECGEPFPWTRQAIDAAKELLTETELTAEEQSNAARDIEDIIQGTQRSKVAIERLKRYSQKAGGWLWGEIKSILVEYASEATKKMIQG